MRSPDGSQAVHTTPTSFKGCLHKQKMQDKKSMTMLGREATHSLALEHDASQETPAVEWVGYRTTHEEVFNLYQEIYQLKRTPGLVPGDQEVVDQIHQEILDSLKEHIWHRQSPTQLEETSGHRSRKPAQAEFHSWNMVNWNHFDCYQDRQKELQEEALRVDRDAHHQVLVAATLLEGHIVSLHLSVSHGWTCSQRQSNSTECRRSRSRRCTRSSKWHQSASTASVAGHPGETPKRRVPSPSLVQLRRMVMFGDSSTDEIPPLPSGSSLTQSQDMADWSQPEARDLRGPPSLDPQLESFLRGEETQAKTNEGEITQQPPFEDPHAWVAWKAQQVNMSTWWPEWKVVPCRGDIHEFMRRV